MAKPTLFIYDLETSGVSARSGDRIMQFAGQRLSLGLEDIGEPINLLLALTPDVLPEPEAILITSITPQKSIEAGISEADFSRQFINQIAIPGTIFAGFNSIRFDDEFIRFLLYRNYYDAYGWHSTNERSRWDLLDVARMMRALRPEGLKWPFGSDGRPSNRLGLLAGINKLAHDQVHDALSDVTALISLARLIRTNQPKLFDYLLKMRNKNAVKALVLAGLPFIYTSGKYPSETLHTTAVQTVLAQADQRGVVVFDLRSDPTSLKNISPEAIAKAWQAYPRDDTQPRFPLKSLQFNRCPAIAPLSVLDKNSAKRLLLDESTIAANAKKLAKLTTLPPKIAEALEIMNKARQTSLLVNETTVDSQLYDSFVPPQDKKTAMAMHKLKPDSLVSKPPVFSDQRLQKLLPLYLARNFPKLINDEIRQVWESYRATKLLGGGQGSQAAKYFAKLAELAKRPDLTQKQQFLLTELQLYGQGILPGE